MKLSILMPVYNEEASIAHVVAEWMDAFRQTVGNDFVFCALNDGSKDRTPTILAELRGLASPRGPAREAYVEAVRYLGNNVHRMNYPYYLSQGWQIGSGPIESACKTVVGQRLKLAGMRWRAYGTDTICHLRALFKSEKGQWQNDITGVYLAGALHLLHKDSDAERLIGNYKIDNHKSMERDDFFQPLGTDSQYIAVLAREFPARLHKISAQQFEHILEPIGEGQFNTLSSAYAVRALKAYSHAVAQNPPELSIIELHKDKSESRLTSGMWRIGTSSGLRRRRPGPVRRDRVRTSTPGPTPSSSVVC